MTAAPLPYAMQLKAAAEYISVSEKTLRRLVEQGRIPHIRHTAAEKVPGAKAGVWLFRTADLQAYIDQLAIEQHPAERVMHG